ncbi:Protein MAIN-LIKE 1 [Glycine soja]
MVRTRGLGRALGHVTSRGVGRGDRDDSDDASQRRWPSASARRQRVAVTAAHDEPVVPALDVEADVFLDDPMAPADLEDIVAGIPADTGAEAVEDEHEGFSGGPSDPSVLTQYADHVACSVWTGEERPELKLSSHGRKVHSLGKPVLAIEGLVAGTGLSPLIACLEDTGDQGLLSSFVERWHRETSSFHLPVGELTITLDDVSSLLHLPVVGDLHAFPPLHEDDAVQMLVDLLIVSAESARAETAQCRGQYSDREVRLGGGCSGAYVRSAERCLYQQQLTAWRLHHTAAVTDSTADQEYNKDTPRACRWIATKKTVKSIRTPTYRERLDRLRIPDVCWIPYGEHRPRGSRGSLDTRRPFPLLLSIHGCRTMIYTTGGCTTRIISFQQVRCALCQTDIPHVPEPGASSTSVEEPRHAVEVCDEIAERLERHLSLGVVTPDSSTHEVIEECLRMARSVTPNHLVYVRSRRRRRTDQA